MKKINVPEITIPVNIIEAVATVAIGACTSEVVDTALKEVDCNKYVKALGRHGATTGINVLTALLALTMLMDDSSNFKIGGKKNKEVKADKKADRKAPRKKDIKRFKKAMYLWENMVEPAEKLSKWMDENPNLPIPEDIKIDNKIVDKFDEIMYKLSKRVGFEFVPIVCSSAPEVVMQDILRSADKVTEQLKDCCAFCFGKPVEDDEITYDISTLDGVNLDDIFKSEKSIIKDDILKIFNNKDVVMTADQLTFIIENSDDDDIKNVIKKFVAGEITATHAADMLIALTIDDGEDEEIPVDMNMSKIKQLLDGDNIDLDEYADHHEVREILNRFGRGEISAVNASVKICNIINPKRVADVETTDKDEEKYGPKKKNK